MLSLPRLQIVAIQTEIAGTDWNDSAGGDQQSLMIIVWLLLTSHLLPRLDAYPEAEQFIRRLS